jgi:arylsulfatase
MKIGKGAPGTVRLFIDGKQAGEGKVPVTCPLAYGLSGDGLCCGRDTLTPVSADYSDEYPFTGTIRRVVVDLASDVHAVPKKTDRD